MPLNERNHMVMPNGVVKHYAIVVMCGSGFIVSVWVASSASALLGILFRATTREEEHGC